MSCNYADGLSPYEDKGVVGIAEVFDSPEVLRRKVNTLSEWIAESEHMVVYTGAGISTASGIPDFRGPNGVWTLEKKGLKPEKSVSFDRALPTATHMAIVKLISEGVVKHVVSQNIDGLHLKSGLPRHKITELHGNIFIEKCSHCQKQFIRRTATTTVGQVCLDKDCPSADPKPCRGKLHDIVLDWEDELPAGELEVAEAHSLAADLAIALGTTLQINPSGSLPINCKRNGGKFVICNLQPTKYDRKADLVIHAYVDQVTALLMKRLGLDVPPYRRDADPTTQQAPHNLEWTLTPANVKLEVAICRAVLNASIARNRSYLRQRTTRSFPIPAKKPRIEEINAKPDSFKAKVEPLDDVDVDGTPITIECPSNEECEQRCEDEDIIAWRRSFNNHSAKLNDEECDINEERNSEVICLDDDEEDDGSDEDESDDGENYDESDDDEYDDDENVNEDDDDGTVSSTQCDNNDDETQSDENKDAGESDGENNVRKDDRDRISETGTENNGSEGDNDDGNYVQSDDCNVVQNYDGNNIVSSALPDNSDDDVFFVE